MEGELVQNLFCHSVMCLDVGWYSLQQLQQLLLSKMTLLKTGCKCGWDLHLAKEVAHDCLMQENPPTSQHPTEGRKKWITLYVRNNKVYFNLEWEVWASEIFSFAESEQCHQVCIQLMGRNCMRPQCTLMLLFITFINRHLWLTTKKLHTLQLSIHSNYIQRTDLVHSLPC
jgi:hypothetical protein